MTDQRLYTGKIIDAHCHISSAKFIPNDFFEGVARNVAVKLAATGVHKSVHALVESTLQKAQDHLGDGLVAEMDAAGIDQAVVLLPDFTYVMKSALTIHEMFECHYEIVQRHGERLYIFAGVDPRWGADGVTLFNQGVRKFGFRGLKLYPPCGYSPSDRMLYPYYEICSELNLPVLLHIGPTSPVLSFDYSHPHLIDAAARDFPGVNFILAHGAVHHVDDCVALCAYRHNIYLDISAFLGSTHPQGWQVSLSKLFARNINHKILFGTDWPVFRNAGGQKRIMDALLSSAGPLSKVSSVQRGWLMQENLRRLLPTF
jgi:hypothetical protein